MFKNALKFENRDRFSTSWMKSHIADASYQKFHGWVLTLKAIQLSNTCSTHCVTTTLHTVQYSIVNLENTFKSPKSYVKHGCLSTSHLIWNSLFLFSDKDWTGGIDRKRKSWTWFCNYSNWNLITFDNFVI